MTPCSRLRHKATMRQLVREVEAESLRPPIVNGCGPEAEQVVEMMRRFARISAGIVDEICRNNENFLAVAFYLDQYLPQLAEQQEIPPNLIRHQGENRRFADDRSPKEMIRAPLIDPIWRSARLCKGRMIDAETQAALAFDPGSEIRVKSDTMWRNFLHDAAKALREEEDWAHLPTHDQGKVTLVAVHRVQSIIDAAAEQGSENAPISLFLLKLRLTRARRSFLEDWHDEYACGSSTFKKMINLTQV